MVDNEHTEHHSWIFAVAATDATHEADVAYLTSLPIASGVRGVLDAAANADCAVAWSMCL